MDRTSYLTPVSYAIAVLLLVGLFSAFGVSLVQGSTVNVTAAVNQTVTCSTNIGSVAFGTLSAGSISSTTGTNNASSSLSCNDGLGCTLDIQDQGNGSSPGLATSSPAYLIASANATLAAGTEGYGVQVATTSGGTGVNLTLNPAYSSITYAAVGGLLRTPTTLASSTGIIGSRQVVVSHWAAIAATTQAGNYIDTITYSCVGN